MPNSVVVGSQWGDEGKAKVIDYLAEQSDLIIRFQGGANAGHTVIVEDQKFVFHLVPSGIMYPGKICIVGNGVVFDAEQFLTEIDELANKSISVDGRLFVSDRAHLVLPYHKALDQAAESKKGKSAIGTTGRGIGPTYGDKISRVGIRAGDLLDWDNFVARATWNFKEKKRHIEALFGVEVTLDLDEILERYKGVKERMEPFLTDTSRYIYEAKSQGKSLLFEGAQGTFLDIDHGTFPFVTSSNTISGASCTGSGVGPTTIDHVIGIVKTYTTRVGNGPFPTELLDETGEFLRQEGGEVGATTGRPRRCGWFDAVMVRKAVEVNGLTRLALTKLDVLNKMDEIKICTHYEVNGEKQEFFPTSQVNLDEVKPVYETMPGWKEDICKCKNYSDLPAAAKAYVSRLKELCHHIPILMVSVGPERSQTLEVEPI